MKKKIAALAAAIVLANVHAASAQEDPGGSVRVHIDADPHVVLEMRDAAGWAVICSAPCDLRVPLDAQYRVNGDGIQQSKKLSLPSTYGTARLEVAPAPAGLHVLGVLGLSLGGVAIAGGLTTMLFAVFTEACSECIGGFANTTAPNVAWALMGAGLASMIGGGILAAETHTQVDVTTVDGPAARAAVIPERRAIVVPPAVGVPLLGLSF